jgi:hypothetical protein
LSGPGIRLACTHNVGITLAVYVKESKGPSEHTGLGPISHSGQPLKVRNFAVAKECCAVCLTHLPQR